MKSLTLLLIILTATANAQDLNSLKGINTTESEIILKEAIKRFVSDQTGKVDTVELKDGQIIYNEEVKTFIYNVNNNTINLPTGLLRLPPESNININSESALFKKVGGDGSGGG